MSANRSLTYAGWKLGGCWLALELSSHCHWTPSFLALNPAHLNGIMRSVPSTSCIALWVVSLGLLTAAEGFTDGKVTNLGWQKGQGEMVFIYSIPGHSPFFPNLMLSIHFVAKGSSFLSFFVLISYWARVEVTSSTDISYSCISAMALNIASIAFTTIRHPGKNLVLKS